LHIERALDRITGSTGFLLILLLALSCPGFLISTLAQGAATVMAAKVQQRYSAVTTVRADFRQNYRAPGIEMEESGTLWMKKPGLMRWEYQSPEPKLFISDGRQTYLYTPADRQVMVSRFSPSELHSTPLEFLLGRGDILRSFRVSIEPGDKPRVEGTFMLRLVPVDPDPNYAYFLLECDSRTFDLRRIVVRESTGNTSEFLLTNLQTNIQTDSKRFDFKIPKGVEVIRVDEK
jgi:outer membrane lipoprotein carrier protein